MTITELKEIKEKIANESDVKQRLRRENTACFIPSEFYKTGITKKQLFMRELRKAILKQMNAQSIIIEESDKRCVL